MDIYLVGGSVRDGILGLEPKDLDYVMPCSYEQMVQFLLEKDCVLVHEKPEFLTCRVKFPGKSGVVDFTCCRKESDYDGRRPAKTETATILEDLGRRDFTVNSIARRVDENFELTDEYLDPFLGRLDLKVNKLKFVGNPTERLKEDGLRWLRAIRFQIVKGLEPTPETELVLQNVVNPITSIVSTERIREELYKCFYFNTEKTLIVLNKYPTHWSRPELWLMPTTKK